MRPSRFYDPISHQYTVDGEPWLSVTQVLVMAGLINQTNYTPEAAERGRQVHRFCELVDVAEWAARRGKDEMQQRSLTQAAHWRDQHPALMRFADAYLTFINEYRPEFVAIERPRFSQRYRMAGRPDRIFRRLRHVHGGGIIEIKTGVRQSWHALQTVGYQLLRATGSRWVLYLHDTGRYRFSRFPSASDYIEFANALKDAQHAQRFSV